MIYNIVSPFKYEINGDSQVDAIKKFIKFNYDLNINSMIIKDQQKHMQANMNYYRKNGQNKVGIDMYPVNYIPIISEGTNTPPYNIILGLQNIKKEDKKEEDKKEEEDKKISYKIVVPQQMPIMPPEASGPFRLPNYFPTVYDVYKNDNNNEARVLLPIRMPY